MQTLPWIVALAALVVSGLGLAVWLLKMRTAKKGVPLPKEWAVAARPVFSTDERRVYRLLREALPHQIVLSKLPLVRFCQPTDPNDVRYWYDLLGANHVAFAICSANGRVLAAIDLDMDRGNSRRVLMIKQSVLSACRVRYLRCPVDNLPSVAELQLLVPQGGAAARAPQPAPAPSPPAHDLNQARDSLSSVVASRRAERTALWQDSSLFQDSFFAPDNRLDGLSNSEFSALSSPSSLPSRSRSPTSTRRSAADHDDSVDTDADELGGVVIDATPRLTANSRH